MVGMPLGPKNTYSKEYPNGDNYLFSSYVKYLEQAGAGVVPILMSQEEDYYRDLFNKINGLTTKREPGFKSSAGRSNEKGDYFPLWGTCLGFELLANLAAEENILEQCHADNVLMPLHFSPGFKGRAYRKEDSFVRPKQNDLKMETVRLGHPKCHPH
ncbi:hypothetical protein NP493_738g01009 [Ridgeia piscesae]|uniref:Folate gamma-glutamyl hydrolase n=1 Tax=Ridgeia piscesae TaxID=27915 RepID=A0AAD9KQC3_RIDPI|nr:hypothetical protein NP493_738g01009 [Ridgeia piscesae]